MWLLLVKARVKGHQRGGRFVSAYDRSPGTSGKQHRVPVRPSVFRWSGLSEAPIYADYMRLARKHPDQFKDAVSAMLHVEYVLEHPHVVMPATDGRFMMFVRRGSVDKCVVVEKRAKKGARGYMVRTAYILDKGQVAEYLGAVFRGMKGVVKLRKALSGWTPSQRVLDSLTVAKVQLPMPHGMVQLSDIKYSTAPELLRGLH